MAKKSKAELKEDLKAAKEEFKIAKSERRDFEKSNKLAKDTDHTEDPKHGKKWAKLNAMVVKKEEAAAKIEAQIAEVKEEPTERPTKYEYPAEVVTAGDKKKYRATARAEAKKAEKAAAKGEEPAKEKSSKKKKAAPAEEAAVETTVETSKKKKKKSAPVED